MANVAQKKKTDNKSEVSNGQNQNTAGGKKSKNREPRERQAVENVPYGSPEWEKRNLALQIEINSQVIKKPHSAEFYAKTAEEKRALKNAKKDHRKGLRKYGLNHRKHMNVAIDDILAYKERLGKKYNVA